MIVKDVLIATLSIDIDEKTLDNNFIMQFCSNYKVIRRKKLFEGFE